MNPLEALISQIAERLANDGLNLDPSTRARLDALEGRMLRINCTTPPVTLSVTVRAGVLKIRSGTGELAEKPNVIVRGTAAELVSTLLSGGQQSSIGIEGDVAILLEFSALFKHYSPRAPAVVQGLMGAQAADDLLGAAELAFASIRSAAEGLGHALQSSAGMRFANQRDADAFLDAADELRLRIDRLAARVRAEEDRRERSRH